MSAEGTKSAIVAALKGTTRESRLEFLLVQAVGLLVSDAHAKLRQQFIADVRRELFGQGVPR